MKILIVFATIFCQSKLKCEDIGKFSWKQQTNHILTKADSYTLKRYSRQINQKMYETILLLEGGFPRSIKKTTKKGFVEKIYFAADVKMFELFIFKNW